MELQQFYTYNNKLTGFILRCSFMRWGEGGIRIDQGLDLTAYTDFYSSEELHNNVGDSNVNLG